MRLSNGEVLLHWPLDLHVLTQGWYYNNGSLHEATDWRTQNGTDYKRPVYAAEDGTVDQVQNWDGHTKTGMQSYGNMVRIKHDPYKGKTLQTRYAHLSSYCVKVGQKVKEGELIGYSGVTGNVFGAHLHFEVILNGKRTNPLVWLDSDFTTASGNVFTYRPGEHAVQQPDQDASVAQTAQNGTGKGLDQTHYAGIPHAVGTYWEEPQTESNAGDVNITPRLQRVSVTCADSEDGAKIGRLLATLRVPLEATVSDGDAFAIMRIAQTLGCEYNSKYV